MYIHTNNILNLYIKNQFSTLRRNYGFKTVMCSVMDEKCLQYKRRSLSKVVKSFHGQV